MQITTYIVVEVKRPRIVRHRKIAVDCIFPLLRLRCHPFVKWERKARWIELDRRLTVPEEHSMIPLTRWRAHLLTSVSKPRD